jgi:hypothetical protein
MKIGIQKNDFVFIMRNRQRRLFQQKRLLPGNQCNLIVMGVNLMPLNDSPRRLRQGIMALFGLYAPQVAGYQTLKENNGNKHDFGERIPYHTTEGKSVAY